MGTFCKISLGTQPWRLLNDGGSEGLGIWIDSFCGVNNFHAGFEPTSSPQRISTFSHCTRDHSLVLVVYKERICCKQQYATSVSYSGFQHENIFLTWRHTCKNLYYGLRQFSWKRNLPYLTDVPLRPFLRVDTNATRSIVFPKKIQKWFSWAP